MEIEKIRSEVVRICNENQKALRYKRQYPIAKHQEQALTELGLLEYMIPAYRGQLGYSDAEAVIRAARDAGEYVGGINSHGEGDVIKAEPSRLWSLLNSPDAIEAAYKQAATAYHDALMMWLSVHTPESESALNEAHTLYEMAAAAWELSRK